MQNYINQERVEPLKREAALRVKDYKEIYEIFKNNEASLQADRCIQCGDPYCHNKCPLHNFIPFWLKSVSETNFDLAFKLSNQTNPFPEITGRICPQDRLCEGDCTLNEGHGAITIGSIETFISENGFKKGLKPEFPGIKTDKKVAIIGSGPAGISAATYLLRAGIAVDMYEKAKRPGGLLTYGIPNFKLEKEVVFRRFEWMKEGGLNLILNSEVGKDIPFSTLEEKYDAIFIAIGAEESKKANIPNEDKKGVLVAIDFLKNIQQKLFNEEYNRDYLVKGKDVIVIGGGDTAMDCLRTSVREGAKSVTCLYRRDGANMPGSKKEYRNAIEEGVEFVFNVSPKEILINSDGEVIGIEMQKTRLSQKDESGRERVEIIKGSEFKVKADIIIFALGFNNHNPSFINECAIKRDKWGAIITDTNRQTNVKGIYAGGDCFRGSDLAVTAAADGKIAAEAIIKSLLK